MRECSGNGECLLQEDGGGYRKNHTHEGITCVHDCAPIRCKNYELCGDALPETYLKGEGICLTCDIFFGEWNGGKGVLPMRAAAECGVCLEHKPQISLPKCVHTLCIDCMRQIYRYHSFAQGWYEAAVAGADAAEGDEDSVGADPAGGAPALAPPACPLCRT